MQRNPIPSVYCASRVVFTTLSNVGVTCREEGRKKAVQKGDPSVRQCEAAIQAQMKKMNTNRIESRILSAAGI